MFIMTAEKIQKVKELSLKIFGTRDYKAALDVLAPSDYCVLTFLADVQKEGIEIGDILES